MAGGGNGVRANDRVKVRENGCDDIQSSGRGRGNVEDVINEHVRQGLSQKQSVCMCKEDSNSVPEA